MDFIDSVYWGLSGKYFGKPQFCLNRAKIIALFSSWPDYCSVYSATLYGHKCAAFQWRWIRLFMQPKGDKYQANASHVTYNVHCRLVINWPVVELVTSVYFIYQHRPSLDWSVFLSPDCVILNEMLHRRIYAIWFFVHIIIESMLPTLRSVSVKHKYLWLLCQSDVHHTKLPIGTDWLQLYFHGKTRLLSSLLWNKEVCEEQIKYWNSLSICFAVTPWI